MLGLKDMWTVSGFIIPEVKKRVRMSLRLLATANFEIGKPQRDAA